MVRKLYLLFFSRESLFITFGWGAYLMGKFNNIEKNSLQNFAINFVATLHACRFLTGHPPPTHEQHYGRVRDDEPLQFYFALLASC